MKTRMDEKTKEIRLILEGNLAYDESGTVLTSVEHFFQTRWSGYLRGADFTRLRGLYTQTRQYRIVGNIAAGQEAAVRAMLELGRQVLLRTSPETMAILYCPVLGAPAVLTLDEIKDQLLLGLYMAKSPLAVLHVNKLLEKWQEIKPAALRNVAVTVEQGAETKKKGKNSEAKMTKNDREEADDDYVNAKHAAK